MSQNNVIVPKRKREDESIEERFVKQRKFELRRPRDKSTTPSVIPIPKSWRAKYMEPDFTYFPLPKYKNVPWDETRSAVAHIEFMKTVDKMRMDAKLPPLSRFETEAT
jgi:hypothetical protein